MGREQLRAYLSVGRREEWSAGTVSTYINALRRAFGPEKIPEATGAARYRAVGIGTDVARFNSYLALAKKEPEQAAGHLADALSLVRGEPFSGVRAGSYGWADHKDLGDLRGDVADAVHKASADLARLALAAGDYELATWAVGKGLAFSELEDDLNELALEALDLDSDRSALARKWKAIERAFALNDQDVPCGSWSTTKSSGKPVAKGAPDRASTPCPRNPHAKNCAPLSAPSHRCPLRPLS